MLYRRINPFDATSDSLVAGHVGETTEIFSQSFVVQFLGSMQVRTDRGRKRKQIYEAIQLF